MKTAPVTNHVVSTHPSNYASYFLLKYILIWLTRAIAWHHRSTFCWHFPPAGRADYVKTPEHFSRVFHTGYLELLCGISGVFYQCTSSGQSLWGGPVLFKVFATLFIVCWSFHALVRWRSPYSQASTVEVLCILFYRALANKIQENTWVLILWFIQNKLPILDRLPSNQEKETRINKHAKTTKNNTIRHIPWNQQHSCLKRSV